MCSFLRVTLVCPPMGPPGTVLPTETVSSAPLISQYQLLGARLSLQLLGQLFPWSLLSPFPELSLY